MHRRAGDDGARQAHQLLPPRVELTRADTVLAGDLGCGQIRSEALGDNLALLLGRPRTPRFRPGENLDASRTSTPMTVSLRCCLESLTHPMIDLVSLTGLVGFQVAPADQRNVAS